MGADTFEKIAVLDNEVQGRLLDAALTERGIPHVTHSYHSLAYDGIFQLSAGWGHVEAPAAYRDEILSILEDLREAGTEEMKYREESGEGMQ
jgi:hypothetical protein